MEKNSAQRSRELGPVFDNEDRAQSPVEDPIMKKLKSALSTLQEEKRPETTVRLQRNGVVFLKRVHRDS